MKLLANLLMTSCVVTLPLASASEASDVLQRRCDEQERQIRRLELENSRLRELLSDRRDAAVEPPSKRQEIKEVADMSTPAPSPAPKAGPSVHKVQTGETLSVIARKHGTTTSELVKINDLRSAGLIRVGQVLRLPGGKATSPAVASSKAVATHKVGGGETYYSIARRHGITVDDLTRANPGVNPNSLRIGQTLKLSNASPATAADRHLAEKPKETAKKQSSPQAAPRRHEDARSETQLVSNRTAVRSIKITEKTTFGAFASKYGSDPANLNALNGLNLEPKQVLAEGSELYIPAQPN